MVNAYLNKLHIPMKRYPSSTSCNITLAPPTELLTTAFESVGGMPV